MEHTYRVSYRVGEASFDIESTDQEWLEKKEKEYLAKVSQRVPVTAKETVKVSEAVQVALSPSLTINEFYRKHIKSKAIKSRSDIAVFFVYYLQKVQKKEAIKTADITDCFAEISYPNYNKLNMNDILNKAKQRALLNFINSLWSLTITGEDFVLNTITASEQ